MGKEDKTLVEFRGAVREKVSGESEYSRAFSFDELRHGVLRQKFITPASTATVTITTSDVKGKARFIFVRCPNQLDIWLATGYGSYAIRTCGFFAGQIKSDNVWMANASSQSQTVDVIVGA